MLVYFFMEGLHPTVPSVKMADVFASYMSACMFLSCHVA